MSKEKFAPIDPETEVTREDIAKMAGTSLSKVVIATKVKKLGFPQPIRKGYKATLLYSRAAVLEWLEKNNLKATVLTQEDRAPKRTVAKTETGFYIAGLAKLQIGINPPQFNRIGTSKRVHVPERNDYEKPNSKLTSVYRSGAESFSVLGMAI